jgi:hypothetical protein
VLSGGFGDGGGNFCGGCVEWVLLRRGAGYRADQTEYQKRG